MVLWVLWADGPMGRRSYGSYGPTVYQRRTRQCFREEISQYNYTIKQFYLTQKTLYNNHKI